MDVNIVPFDASSNLIIGVKQAYRDVWGEDAGIHLDNHVTYEGWQGLAGTIDSEVVRFIWGYQPAPGQWFHDRAKPALPPETFATWFDGTFELAELGVVPGYRGRGIGTALHDRLFSDVPKERAVTVTDMENHAAKRLYRELGWTVIEASVTFTGSEQVLLGLDLGDGDRRTSGCVRQHESVVHNVRRDASRVWRKA